MPTWPIHEIRELLEPTLAHMGFSIYSLEQAGSGGRTLRIAIDKAEGFISIVDCERVSHVAGPLLDQADLIPDSYTLEVSSPGAERPLRSQSEYERFIGRKVNVRYRSGAAEGVVEGALVAVDDAGIAVQGRATDVHHLSWDDVLAGRLAVSL
jgi:ribosome maturation factor RimP